MKKIIISLLILSSLLCLFSCTGNAEPAQGLTYQTSNDGKSFIVTGIGSFDGKNLVIPAVYQGKVVSAIKGGAFSGVKLRSVTIPETVKSIGKDAFAGSTVYKTKKGVRYIDNWAYISDKDAKKVTIVDGTVGIADSAFADEKETTTLNLPKSLKYIGALSFSYCKNLKDIHFSGTKLQWEAIEKAENWNSGMGDYTVHCSNGEIANG